MNDMLKHEIKYRGKKILDSLNKHVILCGCGAIGSNLAVNLVCQGFTKLSLVDCDRVEGHNIGTQAYTTHDVGRLKVHSLEHILYEISDFDDLEILQFNKRITKTKAPLKGDIIIDAFDNTESRQILKDYGDKHNIPVLHGGLYEDYAECIWNNNYIVPQTTEGLDVCDYPLARNIVVLLTAVMSEEIIKFCSGQSLNDWSITLKDLQIKRL